MIMEGTRKEQLLLGYVVLGLVLLTGVVFITRILNSDLYFAKKVFTGLVRGAPSAARMIDWPSFQALDLNVGESYAALPSIKDKSAYEKVFIKNFSTGFEKTGARFDSFIRWRVYGRDTGRVIIAADYPAKGKTLLFYINKIDRTKLVKLSWE